MGALALIGTELARVGRLHPLLVHAPIGFLLAALVLEVLATRRKVARSALAAFLLLTALSAVLTAAAGWVLGHEEGYAGETLARHERLGLALAATAVLVALVHDRSGRSSVRLGAYRALLVAACVLLVPTGHLGSILTHGGDWLDGPRAKDELLVPSASAAAPSLPPPENETVAASDASATPAESVASTISPTPEGLPATANGYDVIAPFLAARCTHCHGETKHKGGLRLDSLAGMLTGGSTGPAFVPGDPAASLMLHRARLPLEHEDHMPPEGKPQPTAAELDALERWIAASAPNGAAAAPSGASVPPAAEPPPVAAASPAPASAELAEPPADALAALDRALVHHERVEPARPERWIDVAAVAPTFGDAELRALLVPLAPWIAELSLARSAVSDAALAELARFPRLSRLDLRATGVGDAGLTAFAGSTTLARLNLAQTKIGDASLELFLALPQLRTLSLWNSAVTTDGLARLRTARPELRVEAGDEPPSDALASEEKLVFTSDRPLPGAELVPAALRPVNTVCPVSGKPVNPKYSLVHTSAAGTRVIGFCCPNCPKDFWADPVRFEATLH